MMTTRLVYAFKYFTSNTDKVDPRKLEQEGGLIRRVVHLTAKSRLTAEQP